MLKTLLKFQVKPVATTEEILKYSSLKKALIALLVIISLKVTGNGLLFLYYGQFNLKLFIIPVFYSIIYFYFFNLIVWLVGKLLHYQGTYRDISILNAYSGIINFVIVDCLFFAKIYYYTYKYRHNYIGIWIPGVGYEDLFGILLEKIHYIGLIIYIVIFAKSLSVSGKISFKNTLFQVISVLGFFYCINLFFGQMGIYGFYDFLDYTGLGIYL